MDINLSYPLNNRKIRGFVHPIKGKMLVSECFGWVVSVAEPV